MLQSERVIYKIIFRKSVPIKISWKCREVTDGAGPSTANSGQCRRLAAPGDPSRPSHHHAIATAATCRAALRGVAAGWKITDFQK
jgi:hypothetical protein